MTLPRTAAEVLSGHMTLEVRCTDRMLFDLVSGVPCCPARHLRRAVAVVMGPTVYRRRPARQQSRHAD
jgi:hypothetical protein